MQTTVSVRGQTVIPRHIREKFNITTSTRLEWEVKNGIIIIMPLPEDPVRAAVGILKGRGPTTSELLDERKADRERE